MKYKYVSKMKIEYFLFQLQVSFNFITNLMENSLNMFADTATQIFIILHGLLHIINGSLHYSIFLYFKYLKKWN